MQKREIKLKDMFKNDMIITKILQGCNGDVRIDCKRRHFKADEKNTFSEWSSRSYANRLAKENYFKEIEEFDCYTF